MILTNTFRERLAAGHPTLGTHFMFTDPDIPELIGDTGLFDYGEFSAEYAAFDLPRLYHLARAAQAGGLPLMIKPDQASQGFVAQGALGAGFKAVLFTDIRTPLDVEIAHRIIRPDQPGVAGDMGVKLRRPALSSYDTGAYLADLKSIVFCIMIEKSIAVDHLDAILARARELGVDMTQWGPADFSFSRGEPSLQHSEAIKPFEALVIKKSLEYGIYPRIELGSVEQAKRYIDMGVRHFCIGWDRFILRQQLVSLGTGMRKLTSRL